jgi:hypothetical protein
MLEDKISLSAAYDKKGQFKLADNLWRRMFNTIWGNMDDDPAIPDESSQSPYLEKITDEYIASLPTLPFYENYPDFRSGNNISALIKIPIVTKLNREFFVVFSVYYKNDNWLDPKISVIGNSIMGGNYYNVFHKDIASFPRIIQKHGEQIQQKLNEIINTNSASDAALSITPRDTLINDRSISRANQD